MRARTLKPSFFHNEHLGQLPAEARLLYAGLWCLADREGILQDRPARIKAELFPYDGHIAPGTVDNWLAALADADMVEPMIIRYEAEGRRLILVPKLVVHSPPHRHEAASRFPPRRSMSPDVQPVPDMPGHVATWQDTGDMPEPAAAPCRPSSPLPSPLSSVLRESRMEGEEGPREKREPDLSSIEEQLNRANALLLSCPAYTADDPVLSRLLRLYPQIDVELEAAKVAAFFAAKRGAARRRTCSARFLLNWWARADQDRQLQEAQREGVRLAAAGGGPTSAGPAAGTRLPRYEHPRLQSDRAWKRARAAAERARAELAQRGLAVRATTAPATVAAAKIIEQ